VRVHADAVAVGPCRVLAQPYESARDVELEIAKW
jgi:hypothetical protein